MSSLSEDNSNLPLVSNLTIPSLEENKNVTFSTFIEWNYVDAPNPNLICSVCTYPFIHPMTLHCSHTFCHVCITESLKHRNQCPMCREPCTTEPQRAPLVLRNLVDELLVYCPYTECKTQGQRQWMLQQHIDTCPFQPTTTLPHSVSGTRHGSFSACMNELKKQTNLLHQLQSNQHQLSQRLSSIETTLETTILPSLVSCETNQSNLIQELHVFRKMVSEIHPFKFEILHGYSHFQAEIQDLRRSFFAISEILKKLMKDQHKKSCNVFSPVHAWYVSEVGAPPPYFTSF